MKQALDQFRDNLSTVRSLGGIQRALKAQTTGILDLSDILRAEIVMAVSALDQYVHELVRLGMLEIQAGVRAASPAFLKFPVTLASATQGIQNPGNNDWLDNEIRSRHGWQSFQQPEKIGEAVRLFSGVEGLWDKVGAQLGMTAKDVKTQLQLIADRRNKIAHEADLDPTTPGVRWPIDEKMTEDTINFVEQVAEALYKVVV